MTKSLYAHSSFIRLSCYQIVFKAPHKPKCMVFILLGKSIIIMQYNLKFKTLNYATSKIKQLTRHVLQADFISDHRNEF